MSKRKLINGNYAAIDIGSNAVRLLIKRISFTESGFCSFKEQLIRVPLRLGTEVFTKGRIPKEKEKKLCKLILSFLELMKLYEVIDYRTCATSAFRDAKNSKDIISMLKEKTGGKKIHILSGKEEARLIYSTRAEFINDKMEDYLYVDVGGGSTEINLMIASKLVFTNSYNIGTLRVLNDAVSPEEWARLDADLTALVHKYSYVDILGSGGNINKLYRLVDNRDKKRQRMSVDALKDINDSICSLELEDRIRRYRLKYDRADVIVPAAQIFLRIADLVHADYIYVPTIGLADGIIDDMIARKFHKYAASEMGLDPSAPALQAIDE